MMPNDLLAVYEAGRMAGEASGFAWLFEYQSPFQHTVKRARPSRINIERGRGVGVGGGQEALHNFEKIVLTP